MPSGAKRICLVTKCTSDNGRPLTQAHLIFSPVSVCIVHAINIIINQCYQVFKLPKPNLEFSVVLLLGSKETVDDREQDRVKDFGLELKANRTITADDVQRTPLYILHQQT